MIELEPLPTVQEPQTDGSPYARRLPKSAAFDWLKAGIRDTMTDPWQSVVYGVLMVVLAYVVLGALYLMGMLYLALPAISGFLIVAPLFAMGLYEKSRRLEQGQRISLREMLAVRPASGGQILFAGLMLGILVLMWLRAADMLYALFFGLTPFPGAAEALEDVFTTQRGWLLLVVGSVVGGLFAALAFAVSMFSIPMLTTENRDALTAMGHSFAMTNRNLKVCMTWGAIVVVGLAFAAATRLLGLAIVFPILGHGTWHAFRAIDTGRR